jgi:putative hydrolase of the HAD superfamily
MNVVFDLGGVVVAWRPDEIVARAFVDPHTRLIVEREIIRHPDWLELDRGSLSVDAAVRRAAARTGLSETEVREFIEGVPAALVADADVVALVRRLHGAGHRLFCLSNMPALSMEHLERVYDFWELFSGAVISSRVGHCKPEPAIYEHLIAAYQLDPTDMVFIDDVAANVAAAATFGIRTIRFETVEQCEAELRRLGCL